MKVSIIKTYNSTVLNRLVKAGEEFEVTEERADKLTKAGVAIVIPTPTDVVTKPKRTSKKK